MIIYFYKTPESSYVKIPIRSSATINIKNCDKYSFLWSILAQLNPCKDSHPSRVSNYRQNFDRINIDGFDITNGLKCNDVHKLKELNQISIKFVQVDIDCCIKISTFSLERYMLFQVNIILYLYVDGVWVPLHLKMFY